MSSGNVVSHGLDYLRFKVWSDRDILCIAQRVEYVDINTPWFHGERFVDITGEQLSVIRTVENVPSLAAEIAKLYPVNRVDVFVDVLGNLLDKCQKTGTVISNQGRIETIYSAHLAKRGDKPVFARAYDAKTAGHYPMPVTRFEVEYKRHYAAQLLGVQGWVHNPIAVALNHIRLLLGVSIWVDDVDPIEYEAKATRLEHDRERFYARYGKNIARDISEMGVESFYKFVMECISRRTNDDGKES